MSDANFKNYYLILGVARTASDDEISAAYRALAAKYHPDVSEHEDDQSRLFKEIGHAYQVLSDPMQRRQYDQRLAGQQTRRSIRPTGRHFRSPVTDAFPKFVDELFSEMSADHFGPHGFVKPLSPTEPIIEADLPVTPEEARFGATVSMTLNLPQSCRACDGNGVRDGKPCQSCQGTGLTRTKHQLQVAIPPGTRDSAGVRVRTNEQKILLRVRIRPCW